MFTLNRRTRVFVCKTATDMRASYDSLIDKTKNILNGDPFSGHLFVFVNKRRTSCKCLIWDGTGFVIFAKRLEQGQFSKVNPLYSSDLILSPAEFSLFFEGADMSKRFVDSPQEIIKKQLSKKSEFINNLGHESGRNTQTLDQGAAGHPFA